MLPEALADNSPKRPKPRPIKVRNSSNGSLVSTISPQIGELDPALSIKNQVRYFGHGLTVTR